MNNRERQSDYQEKYQRGFTYSWFRYCREPLENIQGWNEMLNDTSDTIWHLHHRDEIQDDGEVVSREKLNSRGEYYNLPANKLIFLTEFEHKSIHHTGKNHSGAHNPMYGTNKYEITEEELYDLYVVHGLTQQEIGDKFGCCQATIFLYLKKFGIRKQAV